jgi:hypothetical protein
MAPDPLSSRRQALHVPDTGGIRIEDGFPRPVREPPTGVTGLPGTVSIARDRALEGDR